jgi:hypothetical protein
LKHQQTEAHPEGRKRHIAVDTLGLLIVLGDSAASLGDSPVGRQVLDHLAPSVTKAWVDGGYNAKVVEHGADLGVDVEVVRRDFCAPTGRGTSR